MEIDDEYDETFLSKALCDPFDYAMRLRTGEVIRFHYATRKKNGWIFLGFGDNSTQLDELGLPYPAPRGVDVKESDIVWIMDAPEGS